MPDETLPCACAGGDERHAVAVDPEIKATVLTRLRRIEGQVRGLQKMVEEERYCTDIITQVTSVQEALRGVSRSLLRNHLKHCASAAIRAEDPAAAEAVYDALADLIFRGARWPLASSARRSRNASAARYSVSSRSIIAARRAYSRLSGRGAWRPSA